MIAGIGIDAVYIKRMEKWMSKPGLLERYFNKEELSAIMDKGAGTCSSLAARFAAKEAFGKALGIGMSMELKDICVRNTDMGRPELILSGTALKAMERKGASIAHLSLTHEKDNAIAMVVLEYENRN